MSNRRPQRVVALIDMDCFYVQCHLTDPENHQFKGKPSIVVQRNFEKDKILAVSYEARELGIKRKNCTVDQAKEKARSKNVKLQIFRVAEYRNGRPNLAKYRKFSKEVYKVISKYASIVEKASIDEWYVDLTNEEWHSIPLIENYMRVHSNGKLSDARNSMEDNKYQSFRMANKQIDCIRREILHQLGCTSSAGIADCKASAKLISSLNKPNGQAFIFPEDIEKYTATLKLNDINGFGPVNGEKPQKEFNIETTAQLLEIPQQRVVDAGFTPNQVAKWFDLAKGINRSEVIKKEFSNELSIQWEYSSPRTWIKTESKLKSELEVACEALHERLSEVKDDIGFYPKKIAMKISIKDEPNFTKTLPILAPQGIINLELIKSDVIEEMDKLNIRWENVVVTKIQLAAKGFKPRSVLRPQDDINSESEISNLESRDTSWADENTSVSSMGTSSYEVVSATDGEASDSSLEINDWTEINRPLDDATITDTSRASNRHSRFSGSSTGRSGGPGSTYSTGSSENPHAHAECTVKGGIEGRRENGTPIGWNNGSACREDWKDFNLDPLLVENLTKNKFTCPITPQKFALRPILHGEDARVITKPGTGKTLTFVIPIIQKLLNFEVTVKNSISKNRFRYIVDQKCRPVHVKKMNLDEMIDDAEYYLEDGYQRKPQALIIVPTREIAIQVSDDISKLLPKQLKCVSLYSDPQSKVAFKKNRKMKLENYQMKYQNLEQLTTVVNGVNILVSTLGQLAFLQEIRIFDLGDLDFFVIDEADQILSPWKQKRRGRARDRFRYFHSETWMVNMHNEMAQFKLEDSLVVILNEIGLIRYAIDRKHTSTTLKGSERKSKLEAISKKTQIILTSANLQTDNIRSWKDFHNNKKIDPAVDFQKYFMNLNPVFVGTNWMSDDTRQLGHKKLQMPSNIKHVFRMALPYDESLPGDKNNFILDPRRIIITGDKAKNDFVLKTLTKAVKENQTVFIFTERVVDVENLFTFLFEHEDVFNTKYEDKRKPVHARGGMLRNSKWSTIAKISSLESQTDRRAVLEEIKSKTKLILVSSNLCSRGLHFPHVDIVINYTLPEWTDRKATNNLGRIENDYIYRGGRMGREGQSTSGTEPLTIISFFSPRMANFSPAKYEAVRNESDIEANKGGESASEALAPFIVNEIYHFTEPHIDDTADEFIKAYYERKKFLKQ